MKPLKIQNELTIRDSHAVDVYFSEIQRYEPLLPNEEAELCERIKNGDIAARDRLVTHNLKFVISVAKRYQSLGYRLGDLISIGNIGLIRAAENFDHTRGFKFISYAVWWIRQQIMSEIGFKANGIKLPGNRVSVMYRINRFCDDFYTRNQREPDISEISEAVGVDRKLVESIMIASEDISSINVPVEEGSEKDISDTIRDSDDVFESAGESRCNTDSIIKMMSCLEECEKFIITSYYGLNGAKRMDIGEIADYLGTNKRTVKSKLESSIVKMREFWEKKHTQYD